MDQDKDAICELMESGLYTVSENDDYNDTNDYDRAKALWRKHCDPDAIECPECYGSGEVCWDDGWDTCDYSECQECLGTGKVDAPSPPAPPPPPPPPPCPYEVVSGGKQQNGMYLAYAIDKSKPEWWFFTSFSLEDAMDMAREWRVEKCWPTPPAATPPSVSSPPDSPAR